MIVEASAPTPEHGGAVVARASPPRAPAGPSGSSGSKAGSGAKSATKAKKKKKEESESEASVSSASDESLSGSDFGSESDSFAAKKPKKAKVRRETKKEKVCMCVYVVYLSICNALF